MREQENTRRNKKGEGSTMWIYEITKYWVIVKYLRCFCIYESYFFIAATKDL